MRKNYTPEYKAKIVLALLREEKTIGQLSTELGIHASQLSKWRTAAIEGLPELLADRRKRDKRAQEHEELIHDLYAQVGRLTAELTWTKKKSGIHV